MTDKEEKAFDQDWITCPGESLGEWLAGMRLPHSIFWKHYGIPEPTLTALLAGTEPLTEAIAERLELVTGTSRSLWLALEGNYRAGLAAGLRHDHPDPPPDHPPYPTLEVEGK